MWQHAGAVRVRVHHSQGGDHVVEWALQLSAPALLELLGTKQRAQDGVDIAVSLKEGVREAVDERVGNRSLIRHEAPA